MQYAVYGGTLRSELPFPELPTTTGSSNWLLEVRRDAPPAPNQAVQLGHRRVGVEEYTLLRHQAGYRLTYQHAGTFDITPATGTIRWHPIADAPPELARAIVLGPALALLLELDGRFCLHGSCVVAGAEAIAFVGPKHFGKSTLSLALTAAGCRFVSDDTVAIEPGPPTRVHPAVPSMRLWNDTVENLPAGALFGSIERGIKVTASGLAPGVLADRPARLGAIYEIVPVLDGADRAPVERRRLGAAAAAVALSHHRKLPDDLVGLEHAAAQLRRAVSVAASVPVWQLMVPRSWARIEDVVETLIAWHQPVRSPATPGQPAQ